MGTREGVMFKNQRGSSGAGGLLGVAAVLAAWIAIGAVMFTSYRTPEIREAAPCQLVCGPGSFRAKG